MDNTNQPTVAPAPKANDQELKDILNNIGGAPAGASANAPAPAAPKPAEKPSEPAKPAAPAPKPFTPPAPKPADTPASAPKPANNNGGGADGDLEAIKNTALDELRPIAERINLPPAEKFDTLLLIIRTTDDKNLIKYAHEVALQIEDKDKQAQALLDIVKEVDFFTHK